MAMLQLVLLLATLRTSLAYIDLDYFYYTLDTRSNAIVIYGKDQDGNLGLICNDNFMDYDASYFCSLIMYIEMSPEDREFYSYMDFDGRRAKKTTKKKFEYTNLSCIDHFNTITIPDADIMVAATNCTLEPYDVKKGSLPCLSDQVTAVYCYNIHDALATILTAALDKIKLTSSRWLMIVKIYREFYGENINVFDNPYGMDIPFLKTPEENWIVMQCGEYVQTFELFANEKTQQISLSGEWRPGCIECVEIYISLDVGSTQEFYKDYLCPHELFEMDVDWTGDNVDVQFID